MKKKYNLYILESEFVKYSKGIDFDFITYIKQRQEYKNLRYRIKKGYDEKMLHPLPKDK
jgi:hypothetical protein